jgi:hypothetical protein
MVGWLNIENDLCAERMHMDAGRGVCDDFAAGMVDAPMERACTKTFPGREKLTDVSIPQGIHSPSPTRSPQGHRPAPGRSEICFETSIEFGIFRPS